MQQLIKSVPCNINSIQLGKFKTMGFQEMVSWYQKKIGTYDKQQWERTIEQRILHGLTHVPKKTAKLKTELIDVDLVRGSSFPKAKPKHGFVTVTRLALMRLLLLPAYNRWWCQQTSPRVFALLLMLYVLQMLNMALYFFYNICSDDDILEHVSASEVLVPSAMMVILSIIHSQIVSPHTGPAREVLQPKSRRVKRTKRRVLISSRSRTLGSDSKSSPDTGSDKTFSVGESTHNKFTKRVRLRRSSLEDSKAQGKQEKERSKNVIESKCADGIKKVQGPSEDSVPPRQRVRLQVEDREVLQQRETTPLDDDGFESLNGNGSSENGEEGGDETKDDENITMCEDVAGSSQSSAKNGLYHTDNNLSVSSAGSSDGTLQDGSDDRKRPSVKLSSCGNICGLCSKNQISSNDKFDVILRARNTDEDLTPSQSLEHIPSEECPPPPEQTELSSDMCTTPTSSAEKDIQDTDIPDKPFREKWVQEILTKRNESVDNVCDSESDVSAVNVPTKSTQRDRIMIHRRSAQSSQHSSTLVENESSYNSSCESEDVETVSSPGTGGSCPLLTEGTTSAAEWIGITTNSEECSYSSELDESDNQREFNNGNSVELNDHPFAWEFELSPTVILNPSCAASDKVSCTMWEKRDPKKADLSVLDISSAIIARVESMPENMDYFYGGMFMAVVLALLPSVCRLISASSETAINNTNIEETTALSAFQLVNYIIRHTTISLVSFMQTALGSNFWERIVIIIAMFERCMLSALFFFLLAVAERTFKQRFLYAKLFSHLTSFRRARKSELPHFRLNKVRNIKTWLSVRSYLKRRGPQRSVDVIVSAAFLITLLLLSFLSVECLKDSVRLHSEYNLEALVWCLVLGIFLLRFMTLGTKINRKYRNLSVLITEQINLYLQIEQKPNKKEELMVANSVLKLAADLLKELESPFKISGLSANPYLYTITKVVILSALSGVLSEMLGFKLKLHKIKIK